MIEIKDLVKSYGDNKNAVDHISFTIEDGDIFGFIGRNGAGKTTTIKCIIGLHDFQGEVIINGKSVKEKALECKKEMSYVPDNPEIYDYLTGIQYLNFIADIYGVGKEKRTELIEKYSKKLELVDSLGNLISSYSHGMKQKLVLISALIHEPKILILDEPFVGLDPNAVFTLKEIMKEMCSEGRSIFFSTHVLDVAEKICNKVAIISNGKIAACGDIKEIANDKTLEETFLTMVGE